jgi:dipeptidyl aminopeptidase/acylaminoacyl peptidase
MFDLRGYGQSQGKRFSLGYYETRDVLGALDFLKQRGFKPENIGMLGWSMGAATTLLSSAQSQDVRAIVIDSAYADLAEILSREIPKKSHLPGFFNPGIIRMTRLFYGIDIDAIKPAMALEKLGQRHVLIIHGQNDALVPVENAYRLYEKVSHDPKNELWILPNTAHTDAYKNYKREYGKKVAQFFNENLG